MIVEAVALARPPVKVDTVRAGDLPLAAPTAWQGLFGHGALQAGQRVLIPAGAGGVRHFALQFAKAKGADVFATTSGDGVEFVRSLGADLVIDYHARWFDDASPLMDLVFELVGGDTHERSLAVVAAGGALISTFTEPSQSEAARRGARGARYRVQSDGTQLFEIAALIDAGRGWRGCR